MCNGRKKREGGYPLLLTGTIDPRSDGETRNIEQRILQYEDSIARYICETRFDPIVFIDNSPYPFDECKYAELAKKNGKTFEFLRGTPCHEQVQQHGKGYGDGLLIYEGLTKSKVFKNVDVFYKMTGRIFLKNSDAIIRTRDRHRNEFIVYDGMGWCMTYLFKSNKSDYLQVLADTYLESDYEKLRDLEICFWLRLKKANLDIGSFSSYPNIEGRIGETDTPYTRSQMERYVRTIMMKIGMFTMNSNASKLIWGLYMRVSKRKPYVE